MIFGTVPLEPQTIARAIIMGVRDGLVAESNHEWNLAIKRTLRNLGRVNGYEVYASLLHDPDEAPCHEWLLDVVWLGKENLAIHLAVESELGKEEDVLDDFWKLLCIKAPLKVMVYYLYRGSFIRRIEEEYLAKFCHHVSGEKYLLIEFTPKSDDRAHIYEVPNDGYVQHPTFVQLDLGRTAAQ